jgi:outer membrane protein insertion porin family
MKKLIVSGVLVSGLMSSGALLAFEPFIVKEIKVEGVQRITPDAVLQELPIHVGDQLTNEKSNEAIHALFQTGFYKDVKLERDGDTLIVKLIERPSIGKLEITGLKSKDDINKILKQYNLAEGRIYDPNIISKVEQEIIRKYLMEQRYAVRVETKVTPEDRNRVKVVMHVYEGTVATIKEIRFVGNQAFSEQELRRQMFHKTKNLLSWLNKSDHYSKEKLAADLEMLRSYYMDRGYLNFKIESTQVSLSPDKKHVYLTINIYEGPQFHFKNVTVGGEMVIDKQQLQQMIDKRIKPGSVFSRKALIEVRDEMEERLGEEGYSKASIRIVDDIDAANLLVNIRFYVDAHKRIIVRRITFTGNTLTEDRVLRRETEQFEGAWISTKKIKESKEAIMRDGYSTDVDVQTVPVPDTDDQVDLVYKIEEKRNAQVSAGVSYSAAEKLAFNVGADLKNFLGTGKDTNFQFSRGAASQTYLFSYTNPYFTESGIGIKYSLYNQRSNLSKTSTVFNYNLDATGFNITWMFRVSQYGSVRFGGGFDHSILKMYTPTAPIPMQIFIRGYNYHPSFKEVFLDGSVMHNSIDSYLFPNKGLVHSLSGQVSVPVTDMRLYRVDYSISYYKPVYKPLVLNLMLQAGYQNKYGDKPFPFFKNYYLGGPETVRGYAERSLGPQTQQGTTSMPYGGNVMFQGRAQVIFPPPFMKDIKSVRSSLFLDAGQVYDTFYKSVQDGMAQLHSGMRYSAGIGVTWNTPMNIPLSFSYAWPLNARKGTDRVKRFAFSMGGQF